MEHSIVQRGWEKLQEGKKKGEIGTWKIRLGSDQVLG